MNHSLSQSQSQSIHDAVQRRGDIETVKRLLKTMRGQRASPNLNLKDDFNRTPLYCACVRGHTEIEIVKLLLKAKADVNVQDKDGHTALHWPCHEGHTEIVKLLLKAKADVNVQDKDGWTPLYGACRGGHTEIVKLLLETKADVNVQDKDGQTPLYCACLEGHTEIVKLLLEAKADVNVQDKFQQVPLEVCLTSWSINYDCVQLLLEHGADVSLMKKDELDSLYREGLITKATTEQIDRTNVQELVKDIYDDQETEGHIMIGGEEIKFEHIDHISETMAADWKDLARHLPLKEGIAECSTALKQIETQSPCNLKQQCVDMLTDWVTSADNATKSRLCECLRKIDKVKTADEIETMD